MAIFNEQSLEVTDLIVPSAVTTLLRGLKDEHFKLSLSKNSLNTIVDMRLKTKQYINAKEAMQVVEEIKLIDLNP